MIEPPEAVHIPHSHDHDQSKGTRKRWFDIAMAVAVLFVSAGSLYVALHTAETMEALVNANERLVRAQSTPVLQYNHGNRSDDGQDVLGFSITNVGSGPARIIWFEVAPSGANYDEIGKWVFATGTSEVKFTTAPINQIVLAPDEKRTMLTWPRPADETGRKRWELINRDRFNTPVRACYCSVFDQCWQSSLEAEIPQEVPDCERDEGGSGSLTKTG